MDALYDFGDWAWARHHNPLSWYIRPLFVLPFCYFAYKKSLTGVTLTILALLSSMFWFPPPTAPDPSAAAFLAIERRYVAGGWTASKVAATALIPVWFGVLAWASWRRQWLTGVAVITVGTVLKVSWSFYVGGRSAWTIVAPAALGFLICTGGLVWAHGRVHRHPRIRRGTSVR